jgi:Spy/CpxP family protein refolding chaperone
MRLTRLFMAMGLLLSLVFVQPAFAQQDDEHPLGARDRMAQNLWGPRQILRSQSELGITDTQRKAIRKIVKEAETKLIDLRFDLDTEVQTMEDLLAKPRVDEAAALASSRKVMALESEIKLTTLRMLIQIKNQLTPEQQQLLSKKQQSRRKTMRERLKGRDK